MILDTGALSDVLAGNREIRSTLLPEARHQLPVIVLGEFRFGLLRSKRKEALERGLEMLLSEWAVLEVSLQTVPFYARIRERLRVRGRPIPQNDAWIAALALQHAEMLISRDRHFDEVEGLRRIEW